MANWHGCLYFDDNEHPKGVRRYWLVRPPNEERLTLVESDSTGDHIKLSQGQRIRLLERLMRRAHDNPENRLVAIDDLRQLWNAAHRPARQSNVIPTHILALRKLFESASSDRVIVTVPSDSTSYYVRPSVYKTDDVPAHVLAALTIPDSRSGKDTQLELDRPSSERLFLQVKTADLVAYLADVRDRPDQELMPGRRVGLPYYYSPGRMPSDLYIEPFVNKTDIRTPEPSFPGHSDKQARRPSHYAYLPAHTVSGDGHDPFSHAGFQRVKWSVEFESAAPGWRGLVVGGAGQGKSWLSQMSARQVALRSLGSHGQPEELDALDPSMELPLCLRCDELMTRCFDLAAGQTLTRGHVGEAAASLVTGPSATSESSLFRYIRMLFEHGSALLWLFLDAFDEAAIDAQRIKAVFDVLASSHARILVTTRPHAVDRFIQVSRSWPRCVVYELAPLAPQHIDTFIKKWFLGKPGPPVVDDLLGQRAFASVAQSPFLLTYSCVALECHAKNGKTPTSTSMEIYDRVLAEMFERAGFDWGLGTEAFAAVGKDLETIAWEMTRRNPSAPMLRTQDLRDVLSRYGLDDVEIGRRLALYEKARVLYATGSSADRQWIFAHRELSAFLCGRFIGHSYNEAIKPAGSHTSASEAKRIERTLLAKIWQPAWERVVAFALGTIDNPELVVAQLAGPIYLKGTEYEEWTAGVYRGYALMRCLVETAARLDCSTTSPTPLRTMLDELAKRAVLLLGLQNGHLNYSLRKISVLERATIAASFKCSENIFLGLVRSALTDSRAEEARQALEILELIGPLVPWDLARFHASGLLGLLGDAQTTQKAKLAAANVIASLSEVVTTNQCDRAMEFLLSKLEAEVHGIPETAPIVESVESARLRKDREERELRELLGCAEHLALYVSDIRLKRLSSCLTSLLVSGTQSDGIRGAAAKPYVQCCARGDPHSNEFEVAIRILTDSSEGDLVRESVARSIAELANLIPTAWTTTIADALATAMEHEGWTSTQRLATPILDIYWPRFAPDARDRIATVIIAAVESLDGPDYIRQHGASYLVNFNPPASRLVNWETLSQVATDRSQAEMRRINALIMLGSLRKQLSEQARCVLCDQILLIVGECTHEEWNLQRIAYDVLGDLAALCPDEEMSRISAVLVDRILRARTEKNTGNEIVWSLNAIHRLLRSKNRYACRIVVPALVDVVSFLSEIVTSTDRAVREDGTFTGADKRDVQLMFDGPNLNRIAFDALSEVVELIPHNLTADIGLAACKRIRGKLALRGGRVKNYQRLSYCSNWSSVRPAPRERSFSNPSVPISMRQNPRP